jgi:predicted MFS family arabinose efflux permease
MQRLHFRQSVALLLSRRFGTFWFASLLANIGTWAQQMAQPWLMLSLGASPFLLGLDSFALGAPVLLLTLLGGALADQADRRRTIAWFQSVQMLCPVVLVVLVRTGQARPWMVIGLSVIVGVTDALSMPSFQTIVPSIVEPEQIPVGIALNTTQFNLSRILGPALAGVLMASVGAAGAFAVSAASYVPFILVALWVLPKDGPPAAVAHVGQLDRRQLRTHVLAVVREPHLRGGLLTVFATGLLCAPLITFSPVLVRNVFQGGAGQFSAALGAFGLGGLLGATALLFVDPRSDRRPLSARFALLHGGIVVLAALSPWAWSLAVLLTLAGVAMTVSNASANAVLQSRAPARIRGQTVSLFMLAMRGGMALGSLLTGVSVHWLGVREALLFNGLLAVVVQGVTGRAWMRARQA